MAKVRIGFSTEFELENELVGIGTDNPTNTLQALGNIHATNAKAVGITTLTTPFEGFADTKLSLQGSAGAKQHTTSGEIIIEGNPTVSSGTTFTSGPENLTVTDNFTLPGISDDKPSVGTTRFNENLGVLEFYTGVEWRAVNSRVDMSGSGVRSVFAGGNNGGVSPYTITDIQFVNPQTKGNTKTFGDLTQATRNKAGGSSSTRGVFSSGASPNNTTNTNVIEYITIQSEGNSIDFGDSTQARRNNNGASSSTRALFAAGYVSAGSNIIDYVEIATTGNALDFGDITFTGGNNATQYIGCLSSSTRCFIFGGSSGPTVMNIIDYVTIASKGNSVKFGELMSGGNSFQGTQPSNSVRGIMGGGRGLTPTTRKTTIESIIMASEGNSIEFGNLTLARNPSGCSGGTRGLFAAGNTPTYVNIIDYVTIATSGNAEDFGDIHNGSTGYGTCSDSHGGLGGF